MIGLEQGGDQILSLMTRWRIVADDPDPRDIRMARQNTGYEDKGDVAQLGERHVRNVDVVGSNPIISTI